MDAEVRLVEDTAAEARWVGTRVGALGVWALVERVSVVEVVAVPVFEAALVDVLGLLVANIAEVDRNAAGRREEAPSLEPPDEERGLCGESGLPSPFSWAGAVFLMLTGGPFGDFEVEVEVEVAEEEGGTAPAVAALCRMERSEVEGLRRGLVVELLEARWPGVWLRGTGGGMGSVEMSREKETEGEEEAGPSAVGDWEEDDAAEIFWDRMILVRRGDASGSDGVGVGAALAP